MLKRKKKKRIFKNKDSLRDLWDDIQRTNIIGVPEGEEGEKGARELT